MQLNSPKKKIRKEACLTISNITAGTREQIQAVIEANIILPLVHLLATAEFDIKKEAAWSISNAIEGGSPEQSRYLVQQGFIKPLCDLLTCNDPRLLTVALEGIENVLKAGEHEAPSLGGANPYTSFVDEAEGLEKLKKLQDHSDKDVCKKAKHIFETYMVTRNQAIQLLSRNETDGLCCLAWHAAAKEVPLSINLEGVKASPDTLAIACWALSPSVTSLSLKGTDLTAKGLSGCAGCCEAARRLLLC